MISSVCCHKVYLTIVILSRFCNSASYRLMHIRPISLVRSLRTLIGSFLGQGEHHHVTGIYDLQIRHLQAQSDGVKSNGRLAIMDTGLTYVRGEENIRGWRPRSDSLIVEHQYELNRLQHIEAVEKTRQFLQLREILQKGNQLNSLQHLDGIVKALQARWRKTYSSDVGLTPALADSGFQSIDIQANSNDNISSAVKSSSNLSINDEYIGPTTTITAASTTNRPFNFILPFGNATTTTESEAMREKRILTKCLRMLDFGPKYNEKKLSSLFGFNELVLDFLPTPADEKMLNLPTTTNDASDNNCLLNEIKIERKHQDELEEHGSSGSFLQCGELQQNLLCGQCDEVKISPVVNRKGLLLISDDQHPDWVSRWVVVRRPFLYIYDNEKDVLERGIINLTTAQLEFSLDNFITDPLVDGNSPSHAVFLLVSTERKTFMKTQSSAFDIHEWLYALNPLIAGEIRSRLGRIKN